MKIVTGYLYHIKDEFFEKINSKNLMINHRNGHSRPTYFAIRDKDILWFVPISSRIDKYKKIVDKKIEKYGVCKTIIIAKIANKDCAILLQNAFPTLEKYIDHVHLIDGKPLKVISSLKNEILNNFNYMISEKKKGINLFFIDIDEIRKILEKELEETVHN